MSDELINALHRLQAIGSHARHMHTHRLLHAVTRVTLMRFVAIDRHPRRNFSLHLTVCENSW